MKKLRNKIFIAIGAGGVLFLLLCFAFYLYLPEILEDYIIPEFAPRVGLKQLELSIERADINGIKISSLRISEKNRSGVEFKSCSVNLSAQSVQSIELDGLKLSAEFKGGKILIPGIDLPKGNDSSGRGTAKFALPGFLSSDFSLIVRNSQLNILLSDGDFIRIPFNLQLQRHDNHIEYLFEISNFSADYNKSELLIPQFSLSGSLVLNKEAGELSGTAKFADIDAKRGPLKVEGCSGEVPFSFSITKRGIELTLPTETNLKGWCSVAKLTAECEVLKDIKLAIRQTKKQFIITGSYNKLIADRPFDFAVYLTPPTEKEPLIVDITSDFHEKNLDIDFSAIPQLNSTATFSGDIDFHSDIKIRDMKVVASCRIIVENGNIEDKEKKLSIEGLFFDFSVDDLLTLKSKPSQKLSFNKCTYQDFTIENGDFTFQTESADSLLFEKSQFKWCDGTVAVNSFRFIPSHPKDIDMILYCDRLKVAELLNQFNVGHASGEGRVSGKIPVVYHHKKLNIDNGFLYSTPGFGGHIALLDFMGPLSQMSGAMQLDIAKEALRDFNYQWIRIKLNSEKEDLLLQLDMKGAPGSLLPFGFDLSKGGLYKSENPDVTARFLGISFQINFRLPANRVLEYESGFQKLQGKLK